MDRGLTDIEAFYHHWRTIVEPWLDCGWKPCFDRGLTIFEPNYTMGEQFLNHGCIAVGNHAWIVVKLTLNRVYTMGEQLMNFLSSPGMCIKRVQRRIRQVPIVIMYDA